MIRIGHGYDSHRLKDGEFIVIGGVKITSRKSVVAPIQGNDDLSRSMVVHENELVDVSVLEHDLQEFDNNFGGGTDQDLSLSLPLRVDHVPKGIVKHADSHHRSCLATSIARASASVDRPLLPSPC